MRHLTPSISLGIKRCLLDVEGVLRGLYLISLVSGLNCPVLAPCCIQAEYVLTTLEVNADMAQAVLTIKYK
jgi:hypothetical protein